ncbi:dTDP-glucose 4,6-dehydratase [Candidatus Woesearchaeota archaeon]|nr:dTDP-glucose 4,6-dehydratase [Candidatus Woesearchaeota archaeon]
MNKILVTGGCGFIGVNFIRYMLQKYPYKIVNIDLLTYAGNKKSLEGLDKERYYFHEGDINNKKLIEKIVKKHKIDTIVHFAAESHVDRSIKDASAFLYTNVLGTHTLLEVAKKYDLRFHHISTDEVFGSLGPTGKFNEHTAYDPRSPYSASKAASDHLVRAYFHTHKVKITISNCSNNYGPYQFPEKVIPLFITNLIEGRKVPVYGKGLNIRDWIHVIDHCRAIDLILRKGKIGETYCIGGDCELRNIDLAKEILKAFNKDESWIEFVEDRKGHDYRYAIDSSKIKKELGWKTEIAFKEGLKQTIQWYKENEAWWKPLKRRSTI